MEYQFNISSAGLSAESTDGSDRRTLDLQQRPRERLLRYGPLSLSDKDLLAIIINSGVRGKTVELIAAALLEKLDNSNGIPSIEELSAMGGVGVQKACAISAMLEYGRRRWGFNGRRITTPQDAYPLLQHYADRRQERFICLSLNGAHEVLATRIVTIGLVNRTVVHPREVFADPIVDRASAVLVAHNHPSGRLDPSTEDREITARLKAGGELLGIPLLDHLIFTEKAYYSFLQAGLL